MTLYDRDELVARVDLRQLADELLGPHCGSERSPSWTCPIQKHAQTGRTPPLTVFVSRTGEQRFRCHGCGAGGTAIDLVMHVHDLDIRRAMDWLANRTSLQPDAAPERRWQPDPVAAEPHPDIEPYVAACERQLWHRSCTGPVRWLTQERGLSEDILRLNRVGFDPGPIHLDRPDGIPRAVGVVLPVLDDDGRTIYTQTRRLGDIRGSRYLNCAGRAAPNPRVAFYRSTGTRGDPLIVCEGAVDALTAADAGYPSAAVLGSALADDRTAIALVERSTQLVIAFDADEAGERGAKQMEGLLEQLGGCVQVLAPPVDVGDLNAWRVDVGEVWPEVLATAVDQRFRMTRPTPVLERT